MIKGEERKGFKKRILASVRGLYLQEAVEELADLLLDIADIDGDSEMLDLAMEKLSIRSSSGIISDPETDIF